MDAYLARKNEDIPDNEDHVPAPVASSLISGPLLVRSVLNNRLTFSGSPDTTRLCDQMDSSLNGNFECSANSSDQPGNRVLTFNSDTLQNSTPTAPNFMHADSRLQPQTPTFSKMFRRN